MKKAIVGLFFSLLTFSSFAQPCPQTEASLLGDWVSTAKEGAPFEVMSIENGPAGKLFSSWLHDAPDLMDAQWAYEGCVLRITHNYDTRWVTELKVVSASKTTLVLREHLADGTITRKFRYRRPSKS
ncbi:hypothetical protein [Ottowia sp.]|uniref:hypothetical protein n=1 Tax=Ottowia sp. TaxID=1898956 RepID=UPI003A84798B